MYDAALYCGKRLTVKPNFESAGAKTQRVYPATIHRAENTDDPRRLRAIFEGFAEVTQEIKVVYRSTPDSCGIGGSRSLR